MKFMHADATTGKMEVHRDYEELLNEPDDSEEYNDGQMVYEGKFTPCDVQDNDGVYRCPYSDDPTSETCRNCCGLGVDE